MQKIATYQPSKKRRARTVGYRHRSSNKDGLKVLKRRRLKGRWQLTPKLKKF